MRNKWLGIVFTVFISLFAASSVGALEVGMPFDTMKPGQWVRYESEGQNFSSTTTYCIEAFEGEGADAVVVYRFSAFYGGQIGANHQIRMPLDLFKKFCADNYDYAWLEQTPAGTATEEFEDKKMTLSVFKNTSPIPAENGGGTMESTYYLSKDIPITGLFKEESTSPMGEFTKQLTEFGFEIDEDVYPEILPEDPTDITDMVLPALRQAIESGQ